MGCDIHEHVEVRRNGKWEHVYKAQKTKYGWDENYYGIPGRNYSLFALLADVRNYHGRITPISGPKGLPDDASPETKKEADDWDADGHSHSHLTLAELQAHNWENVGYEIGLIDSETYEEWKASGEDFPAEWCGDVYADGIIKLIEPEYLEMKAKGTLPTDKQIYIGCRWGLTDAKMVPHFYGTTLPRLAELDPDPNNVRIVFWFDN